MTINIMLIMKRNCFTLAVFIVGILLCPAGNAAALGPQAGNCNWGNYSRSNTIYLSPQSGENNQDQINDAINRAGAGGSVFLKTGRYIISRPIYLKSNIILEGDKDAIIQLKDHANWKTVSRVGNISEKDAILDSKEIVSNIEIKCFQIDGNFNFRSGSGGGNYNPAFCRCIGVGPNSWATDQRSCENQYVDRCTGSGYYGLLEPRGGNNLSVHDMIMQDGGNDFLDIRNISNVRVYNNLAIASGHEFINGYNIDKMEIFGNKIAVRVNSGLRIDGGSTNVSIHDNEIYGFTQFHDSYINGGGFGIQIARDGTDNIQIFNNVFHGLAGMGVGFTVGNIPMKNGVYPVEIHHNIFVGNGLDYGSATGGVVSNISAAVLVYNNTFDGNFGYGVRDSSNQMFITNNIVTNTGKGQRSSNSGNGIGIFGGREVTYNVFYNNIGGNNTITGPGNFQGDPLYANLVNYDYHLKSRAGRWDPAQKSWVTDSVSSPAIDRGGATSAYGNEPEDNGDRINAGRYGNTTQASLTGASPQNPMPPAPADDSFIGFDGSVVYEGPSSVNYFYPEGSMLDPDPYHSITPALPVPETSLSPWWSRLAELFALRGGNEGGTDISMLFHNPLLLDDPVVLIDNILGFILFLGGGLGLLFIILGGLTYISSSGDMHRAARGKNTVVYAIIGLMVVLFSYALLEIVKRVFAD